MASLFKSTLNTRRLVSGSYRYIRSDAPFRITDEETAFLIEHNITTIIDLRTAEEAERKPVALKDNGAFVYLSMPVTGGGGVPESADKVSQSYLKMADEEMEKILSCIENADTNVLYFCNAGKDRTGVVSAMLLRRLGYSDEAIIADYLLTAENLHDALTDFAASQQIDVNIITPHRRYMEEFLHGLDNK